MLSIHDCVKKIETYVETNESNQLVLFLSSLKDIPPEIRINLDLMVEPDRYPELVDVYEARYDKYAELGIYHPSQYLLRIFDDEIAGVGEFLLNYTDNKKKLKECHESLELLLVERKGEDTTRKIANEHYNHFKKLSALFISEIEKLEQKVLESENPEELLEEKEKLKQIAEVMLPIEQAKKLQETISLEEYQKKFQFYENVANQLKKIGFQFLDYLFENHASLQTSVHKLKTNFSSKKSIFLKKIKEFEELFSETGNPYLFDKSDLVSLIMAVQKRFNLKKPIPIVIMPNEYFTEEYKGRFIVDENGVIKVRKPEKKTGTRVGTRRYEKLETTKINTKSTYKDGVIYLSSDVDLELDAKSLVDRNEKHSPHWPYVPQIARLIGKYLFHKVLKPLEINAKNDREKLLGLYAIDGSLKYNGQGKNNFATSRINYYKNLEPYLKQARFGGFDPATYDDEESWCEMFASDVAYWLISENSKDNPEIKNFEFFAPKDGWHKYIYRQFFSANFRTAWNKK